MDIRDALLDWDDSDDEDSNTAHITEHGLTPEEVEFALLDRPVYRRRLLNPADPPIIRPITAYDVQQPTE